MKDTLKTNRCLNCSTEFTGNFCPHCGQKATVGRITFKETINSFLSASFAIEGPFFYTIKGLIINPGRVFREFLAGKRKLYYKPVAFFILMTAIYIIIRNLLDFDPLEGQIVAVSNQNEKVPEVVIKSRQAARFMVAHINHIMFFLVFAIAIVSKIFFWKKYNLAEFTAIGFLISGMYILFGIPQMFISKYTIFNTNRIQLWVLAIYIIYCLFSLFKKKSFRNILAYLSISMFSIFFYMLLGFGFSLTLMFLKD